MHIWAVAQHDHAGQVHGAGIGLGLPVKTDAFQGPPVQDQVGHLLEGPGHVIYPAGDQGGHGGAADDAQRLLQQGVQQVVPVVDLVLHMEALLVQQIVP